MCPMSTTSMAQDRIRLRSATAATMCRQGRQTSPPPAMRTVGIEPSLHPPSMLVSDDSAPCGYAAPAVAKALAADALSYRVDGFFLVTSIVVVHTKGCFIYVMT